MELTPDELEEKSGVARSTIRGYHRRGIIPKPKTRALGRGKGSESLYPPETLAELEAAKALIGLPVDKVKVTIEEVAEVRRVAYTWTRDDFERAFHSVLAWTNANRRPEFMTLLQEDPDRYERIKREARLHRLLRIWLEKRCRVIQGLPMEDEAPYLHRLTFESGDKPLVHAAKLVKRE